MTEKTIEEELSDSPRFVKYFKSFGYITNPDKTRQTKLIYLIDEFMYRHKTLLEKKINKYKHIKYPSPDGFRQHNYIVFYMLILYNQEIDEKILETEKEHMTELLEFLVEFKKVLISHPNLFISVQQLTAHLVDVIKHEENYKKYKRMRRSILAKIHFFQKIC